MDSLQEQGELGKVTGGGGLKGTLMQCGGRERSSLESVVECETDGLW